MKLLPSPLPAGFLHSADIIFNHIGLDKDKSYLNYPVMLT